MWLCVEVHPSAVLTNPPVLVPPFFLQLPDPLQQRDLRCVADVSVAADTHQDQYPLLPAPHPLGTCTAVVCRSLGSCRVSSKDPAAQLLFLLVCCAEVGYCSVAVVLVSVYCLSLSGCGRLGSVLALLVVVVC
jgi:hypothetical protein